MFRPATWLLSRRAEADRAGDRRVSHTRCEQRLAKPSQGSIIHRIVIEGHVNSRCGVDSTAPNLQLLILVWLTGPHYPAFYSGLGGEAILYVVSAKFVSPLPRRGMGVFVAASCKISCSSEEAWATSRRRSEPPGCHAHPEVLLATSGEPRCRVYHDNGMEQLSAKSI